jgi:nicotinamide-nucleotide amidase
MIRLKDLLLQEPRLSLSVAESVTCGRIQSRIGAISGASGFFLGGLTAYSLEAKVRHLGVERAKAEAVNCVSSEIAEQMAIGVCGHLGSDLGLATTGYAEPCAEHGVTTPFAWWALARNLGDGRMEVQSARVECPGASRTTAQDVMSIAALTGLVRYLTQVRSTRP